MEPKGMTETMTGDDRRSEELDDPYDGLEPGQRRSARTVYLADEYTIYDLVKLNENTGKWKCKTTTYRFSFHPYRVTGVIHSYKMVKPEYLIKLKKVMRRKQSIRRKNNEQQCVLRVRERKGRTLRVSLPWL